MTRHARLYRSIHQERLMAEQRTFPRTSQPIYSTWIDAVSLWDAPGERWTALSAALAVSTQINPFQSSEAMSDMPLVLSIHGFQTTVLSEPLFSTMIRRFHTGSCTTQVT